MKRDLKVLPSFFTIPTHLTDNEKVFLYKKAGELKQRAIIAEIGSYLGASTCFLGAGVKKNGGKVFAVDTWTNLAMSEGPRETYKDFLSNIEPFKDTVTPLRGNSVDIANIFNESIDLLFIDGDHSYGAVCRDIDAWLPKVKENGIVVFHDYGWSDGVKQAVRELILPVQIEGGRHLDSIYWTRVNPNQKKEQKNILASVIVPSYGGPETLKATISSLQNQNLNKAQYEIIVIDNGFNPEFKRWINEYTKSVLPKVRYVQEARTGLHNARHRGVHEAKADIIVYIDDDVIVSPNWLMAIVDAFGNDPLIGCIGGRILPKWEITPPSWVIEQIPSWYLSLLDLGDDRKELIWPEGVFGCNMAIRRSTLYETGGFNPDAFGERKLIWFRGDGETGLHKKIFDIGYKVIYEPKAIAYHCINKSRMKENYFNRRAFDQGISDSYSRIRKNSSKLMMFKHSLRCLFEWIRHFIKGLKSAHVYNYRVMRWYWFGRGQHQVRALLSRKLRMHIIKDTYLYDKTYRNGGEPSHG